MTALWVKSFHIISVVTWFAALFYLPRLFVYHAMAEDEPSRERFKVMERKLYRGIMNPSAIVAVGLGITLLVLQPFWLSQGWLHVKILLVAALVIYHLYCGRLLRAFAEDRNTHSHVWYRWFNEMPVLVLIAVVLLVEFKPWA
ncbi:protoporphyrinogen oxidase HemJ [Spiribacter onubensis]|uniref:Protoporphyrinogen IX oxidase n=1 Tax=Spiribacter onubensis TaxID=3122420 RepID=A0ABV3SAT7_9GAMM